MNSILSRPVEALPSHIVWDWNGTLQDDLQAAVNGINVLLQQRRLPTVSVEQHREMFGFPVRDYYVSLGFQLELEDWEAMAREFHDHFLADATSVLHPAAIPTLEAFRAQGIGMSVLSACQSTILERLLVDYRIDGYFGQVRGLDDLHARSKLENGRELIQSLGLDPGGVWFIGDTDHDWEVANALGARCLLLADGYQSPRRLAKCGCPVAPTLGHVLPFFGLPRS